MAPTVCCSDNDDRRIPFQLETHLLALRIASRASSEVSRGRGLRARRRSRALRQLNLNKTSEPMGVIVDESQQMISGEGDSPGIVYCDSGRTSSSKSDKQWRRQSHPHPHQHPSIPADTPQQQHPFYMRKQREGLMRITMSTMDLLKRNQQLQSSLSALQAETRAFIKSVLSNPENHKENQHVKVKVKEEN
ncbi:uncharacterized protein LOC111050449 isoform X2 [Nilaparvata lugens]|uniref:uncharacterized protein LOC111050449 isoform X2 n=1 Tax=Nilaparvata lugens TaxID=108931 RepID=UPI000B9841C5|nr:uncharacterized protein LOC111050449 isoform X2 [Nilaparvata lugens]